MNNYKHAWNEKRNREDINKKIEILLLKNTVPKIMKQMDSIEEWRQWRKESDNLKTEQ